MTSPDPVAAISDRYVGDVAAASPMTATYIGVQGHDDRLDDLSPDGLASRHQLDLDVLSALRAVPASQGSAVARAVLAERIELGVENYQAGLWHGALNTMASPLQDVRLVFDLMATDTVEDWATVKSRMAQVPTALAGYRQSLLWAADRGVVAATRQVDACAAQCDSYAGGSVPGYFSERAARAEVPAALATDLTRAANAADAAYAELAGFLRGTLRPRAPEKDAVGIDRYRLASRDFTGAQLDLTETYEWGWAEFLSIEAQMRGIARDLVGGSLKAAAAALDADPQYRIDDVAALQRWMQQLSDRSVAELTGTHFEIPEPIRRLECRIAPPGGSLGAYYTGPSDDFSRPGRMWWAVAPGRQTFHTWRETTVVFHEGVPGHHLQIATQVYQRETLNDYQRLLAGTSGHAEGWALYAERLMRELGYLEDPGLLLGMLNDQLFRAARVVLDIGMHLELPLPAGTGFHEGERWTPDIGLEFLRTRTLADPEHAADEINRYLGWPGQAPSYKVGERVWLQAREDARRRHGAAFDLKAFHTAALRLGGMGLDPLRDLLSTL